MKEDFQVIGSRVPRKDAPDKATGSARFIDDLDVSGRLYGALLQSPLAHARIVGMDTSRAERLRGVRSVLTARDIPPVKYGVSPARYDEHVLAVEKVRYVGDEVAAVAAVDLETAMEAVSLIRVDYDPLPYVLDPFEAMAEGAPRIHEQAPGNICVEVHQEFGDVEAVLESCDVIRTGCLKSKNQDGGFLEPHGSLAVYDLQGHLTLYSSTQAPHYVQRTVAMVTGLPMSRVHVIKPYVGGGFGPKAEATPLDLCASLLSMRTGRPVKMNYTREQVFLHSRARHRFFHEMSIGALKDGTLKALRHQCVLDGGAYASFGIATAYYAGSLLGGPYRLPNMKYDGYRVYTNKPACGAQRGHGGVHARALFERQLDLLADDLGMDPVELRLRNVMNAGETTCNQLNMSSLGMRECIEAVAAKSGWKQKRGALPRGKGIGMACGFFVSGAGYPIYRSETPHSTIRLEVHEDGGGVTVYTGSAEIGQGSDTVVAMIAAEALGISYSDVLVRSGSTDYSLDLGAYSSRQTLMTGHAVKRAAEDAKRKILEAVADVLVVDPQGLDIRRGVVETDGTPLDFAASRMRYVQEHRGWTDHPTGDRLTFREAARLAFIRNGPVVGLGSYKPPPLGGEYKGAAVGTSPAFGCSAQVAEVTVDLETGQVVVESVTGAHDCGRAINLTQVEAQMQGAMSMGLGEALFEEVRFDETGRVANPTLGEYRIPTILDMPKIECVVVESDEPNGPYGAKEVGEGAIMPTIPAILNAVKDAVGSAPDELPLHPQRVLGVIMRDGESSGS